VRGGVVGAAAGVLVALTRLWPRSLRARAGDGYRELVAEVLGEAWRGGGWRALVARWLYEAADVLAVAVQVRPVKARVAVVAAAAVTTLVVVAPPLLRARLHADEMVVHALDPAGEFTLRFERGVAVAATVDGVLYVGPRLEQSTDSVRVVDGAGQILVAVAFEAPGTIRWEPRPAAVR
jgi:hypothetical protein